MPAWQLKKNENLENLMGPNFSSRRGTYYETRGTPILDKYRAYPSSMEDNDTRNPGPSRVDREKFALLVSHMSGGSWICDGVVPEERWSAFFRTISVPLQEQQAFVARAVALEIGQEMTIGTKTYTKVKIL
jgi:hypothetical protein